MPIEDLIIPVILALALGFALGYYYIRVRITAIEERSRAELETWKLEIAGEIRKDSVNRSRSTLKGKIAEQMALFFQIFASILQMPVLSGRRWITSYLTD